MKIDRFMRGSWLVATSLVLIAGCANNQYGWNAKMGTMGAPIESIDSQPIDQTRVRLVKGGAIQCPRDAARQKLAEKFKVQIWLNPQGEVIGARAIDAKNELLINAALQSVMQWTFTPLTTGSKPVAVSYMLPVNFRCDLVS